MNQSNSQKIEQKRCMCQADFTFSQLNIHYKRFKFDLIFNKSVRLQFQEEVKDIILESLCLTVTLKIPWFIICTAALQSSLSIEEKIIKNKIFTTKYGCRVRVDRICIRWYWGPRYLLGCDLDLTRVALEGHIPCVG